MKNLIKLIASFFYLGYAPLMSGTVASCFALGLYFLFKNNFCLYTILLIVISALGFLVCGAAEKIFQEKDSSKIVIDEVAGLLLAFWALPQLNLTLVIIGFFLFRALDAFQHHRHVGDGAHRGNRIMAGREQRGRNMPADKAVGTGHKDMHCPDSYPSAAIGLVVGLAVGLAGGSAACSGRFR